MISSKEPPVWEYTERTGGGARDGTTFPSGLLENSLPLFPSAFAFPTARRLNLGRSGKAVAMAGCDVNAASPPIELTPLIRKLRKWLVGLSAPISQWAYSESWFFLLLDPKKLIMGLLLGLKKSSPESLFSCAQTPNPGLSGCANSSGIGCTQKSSIFRSYFSTLGFEFGRFSIRPLLKVAYIFIRIDWLVTVCHRHRRTVTNDHAK